jgi:fucose permease
VVKEMLADLAINVVAFAVFIGIVIGVGRLGEAVAGTIGFAVGLVLALLIDAVLAGILITWRRPHGE